MAHPSSSAATEDLHYKTMSDASSTPPIINGKSPESVSAQGQTLFQCPECPKTFNRRENLSRHSKTHSALPSHHCSKCGRGFTRSDLLKRHFNSHDRWDQQDAKRDGSGPLKRRRLPFRALDAASAQAQVQEQPWPTPQVAPSSFGGEAVIMDPNGQIHQGCHGVPPNPHQGQLHVPYHQGMDAHGSGHVPHPLMPIHHPLQGYQQHMEPLDGSFVPFDFSTFLLPPDLNTMSNPNQWFSYDFYSAMRETGNGWENSDVPMDNSGMPPPETYGHIPPPHEPVEHYNQQRPDYQADHQQNAERHVERPSSLDEEAEPGSISRVSSPPNEASEEDKWLFQWNPQSRQILVAQPIVLEDDHPFFRYHDPRYDISGTTLMRMKSFLTLPQGRGYHQSQKGTFTLPSLPVLNVFIRLFFHHFSPQMPVIHHATVNTNTDLPPPLLAAIIVIGAIYSHLKHTRRFAIVLLDIVRWHLRIALECDNSLMRDPMIVYAQALICHTGIWCGNKRCFELAEVVRGALVTYIRRLRFGEELKATPSTDKEKGSVQEDWKQWIREEQQRRLAWVVYTVDCQFPSILNLPPTISLGEVRNLGCPCDEEFWFATSTRNWKNMLGPASVPPSRSFSAAVGPFLLLTTLPPAADGLRREKSIPGRLPILNLNSWSAFLVLMTLQHQIFQFHQESMITRTFIDDEYGDGAESTSPSEQDNAEHNSITILRNLHSIRRSQLAEALSTFQSSYLTSHHPSASHSHFHASSLVLHHLSTILLDVPLSDLQSAIGKDGLLGITTSMVNLSTWARGTPAVARDVAINAVRSIVFLAPQHWEAAGSTGNGGGEARNAAREADTAPYSLITVFLCHVVLFVFAQVASREQKAELVAMAERESGSEAFVGILRVAFGTDKRGGGGKTGKEAEGEPEVLLKSAAEMLTRLGTWGAALNLALLLQKRAGM